jgi:hypothetical protein
VEETMRTAAAVAALLAAFAAVAFPDGAAPTDEPKVVSIEAWVAELAAARAEPGFSVTRIDRLRALAAARVVERVGRVVDVATDAGGLVLDVCGPWDDALVARFAIRDEEADAAKTWKKWDRLRWRERPSVDAVGEVSTSAIYRGLADLGRSPAVPAEPRPIADRGDHHAFYGWIAEFAKRVYHGDAAGAVASWETGAKRTWVFPAYVVQTTPTLRARLDEDAYVDLLFETSAPGFRPDVGIQLIEHGERLAARWGWTQKDVVDLSCPDPQLLEEIRAAGKPRIDVTIALTPGAANAYAAARGRLPATISAWRQRPKAK